jgi:SAM-dependent methyltransferase
MWDERYGEPGYAYGLQPNDFLLSSLDLLKPGGKLLCLAEGEGRNSVHLAEKGFEVTAVDLSAVGLEKVKRLAEERKVQVETECADLGRYLPAPESYDGVISIFCHLPPVSRTHLHRQVVECLREDGIFILEAYTPKQLNYGTGGPQQKQLLVALEELIQELRPLHFLIAREIDREIHEGRYHNGIGAVVQVIGKKHST